MRDLWRRVEDLVGDKAARYSMVSVISVAVSQAVLLVAFAVVGLGAATSNVIAVSVGAIPSYLLNRAWTWGRTGRSHWRKEVLPFWGVALFGLAASTWAVAWLAHTWDSPLAANVANIGAFGLLWAGKFVFLNRILFRGTLDGPATLDGRQHAGAQRG